jgi:hypothetical protein
MSHPVGRARVVKDAFGGCRLAGINMSDDANISDCLYRTSHDRGTVKSRATTKGEPETLKTKEFRGDTANDNSFTRLHPKHLSSVPWLNRARDYDFGGHRNN